MKVRPHRFGREYELADGTIFVVQFAGMNEPVHGYSFEYGRQWPFPMGAMFEHQNKLARIEEMLLLCETRKDLDDAFNLPPRTTMTQDDVVTLMLSSESEEEWNDNADAVKEAFGGYPAFWYPAVILSGVAYYARQRWQQTVQRTVIP
jgi:hypothetical protein